MSAEIDVIVDRYDYLGYAVDDSSGVVYYFTKLLGAGSSASTFAATTEPGRPPKFAVKDYWSSRRPPRGTENLAVDPETHRRAFQARDVEHEWRINKLITARLSPDFYNKYLICATNAFINSERTRGSIVFPLIGGSAFDHWLAQRLCPVARRFLDNHPTLADLLAQRKQLFDALASEPSTSNTSSGLRGSLAALQYNNRAIFEQFDALQTQMFFLAGQLIDALEMLHRQNIFHGDIKPANMILSQDSAETGMYGLQLRMMDFGASCTTYIDEPGDLSETLRTDIVACDPRITATITYRDPLSLRAPRRNDTAQEYSFFKAAFDVYSLAKVLAVIFDPEMCLLTSVAYDFIVVKKSLYMPDKLYELLRDMVGRETVPGNIGYGYTTLTDGEFNERLDALRVRPKMPQVRRRFEQIIDESDV